MCLAQFVTELAHDGRVHFDDQDDLVELSLRDAISDLDQRHRVHAPALAPDLDYTAAQWAAERLRMACYFLKERSSAQEEVLARLCEPAPFEKSTDQIWSVDLFFRCLEDLQALSAGLPAGDALLEGLAHLCSQWPLSSHDAADPDPTVLATIEAHPCLRRLRAERITP